MQPTFFACAGACAALPSLAVAGLTALASNATATKRPELAAPRRATAWKRRAGVRLPLALLCLALALPATEAATTLARGELVILAFNGDNIDDLNPHDGLSMMPLVNLEPGTEIYVTDIGWSDTPTGAFLNYAGIADKIVKYTAPTAIAAGTIIRCDVDHQADFTLVASRTAKDTLPYFNNISTLNSAEEILVFQGSVEAPTFIFAVTDVFAGWASGVPATGADLRGHGSALPPGLVNDATALSLASGTAAIDNWAYTGSCEPATKAAWLARVGNPANWTGDDGIPTILTGSYAVTDATPPALSINDVSASEGNSGTTTFTFTVALSMPAPAGGVTFDIATADGTATAGIDYVAKSLAGQTIPTGASTYTFGVTVNGDTTFEPNENFSVNVTNITGATVSEIAGTGTIINDDIAPPTYGTWAAAKFSATDLLNPAICGATADPDGAGITNLMRYALDLPARGPVSSVTTAQYNGAASPAILTFSFTVRGDAADLLYEVQSSADLATWATLAPSYTANGTKRTEFVSVTVPTDSTRFFLRLQVVTVP